MSICLLYFEKKFASEHGDFNSVNKYELPNVWVEEKVSVMHQGRNIKASILFDGVSSGNFYFFGRNRDGKCGEAYRDTLRKFISSRLINPCVAAFIYLDIFDDISGMNAIILPDTFKEISLTDLDNIFKERIYNGFFMLSRKFCYEKDYDRVFGKNGEKGHVVVRDKAKDKVITSYPTNFD